MIVKWTRRATLDVERLCRFFAEYDHAAARELAKRLDAAPEQLISFPRLGQRVDGYELKEVRKLIISRYVLHYEVVDNEVLIMRIWHVREDRPG